MILPFFTSTANAWRGPEYEDELAKVTDRSRLKSGIFEYIKVEDTEGSYSITTRVLCVLSGDKFFIRQSVSPWIHMDLTVKPALITTNYTWMTYLYWFNGKELVRGNTNPDYLWDIYPATDNLVETTRTYIEIARICYLEPVNTNATRNRLVEEKDTPEGHQYVYETPRFIAEYTVSLNDGDGLLPIRLRGTWKKTQEHFSEWEWMGWQKYGGDVWVPQTAVTEGFQEDTIYDRGTGTTTVKKRLHKSTYTVLSVEKVNEPINAKWFMPQFPDYRVRVWDNTGPFKQEDWNFDLEGHTYGSSLNDYAAPESGSPSNQPPSSETQDSAPVKEL